MRLFETRPITEPSRLASRPYGACVSMSLTHESPMVDYGSDEELTSGNGANTDDGVVTERVGLLGVASSTATSMGAGIATSSNTATGGSVSVNDAPRAHYNDADSSRALKLPSHINYGMILTWSGSSERRQNQKSQKQGSQCESQLQSAQHVMALEEASGDYMTEPDHCGLHVCVSGVTYAARVSFDGVHPNNFRGISAILCFSRAMVWWTGRTTSSGSSCIHGTVSSTGSKTSRPCHPRLRVTSL